MRMGRYLFDLLPLFQADILQISLNIESKIWEALFGICRNGKPHDALMSWLRIDA